MHRWGEWFIRIACMRCYSLPVSEAWLYSEAAFPTLGNTLTKVSILNLKTSTLVQCTDSNSYQKWQYTLWWMGCFIPREKSLHFIDDRSGVTFGLAWHVCLDPEQYWIYHQLNTCFQLHYAISISCGLHRTDPFACGWTVLRHQFYFLIEPYYHEQ